jgi:hypothetical protein
MENTYKNLLDAHLQGDKAAFGKLTRPYGESVISIALKG